MGYWHLWHLFAYTEVVAIDHGETASSTPAVVTDIRATASSRRLPIRTLNIASNNNELPTPTPSGTLNVVQYGRTTSSGKP